MYNPNMFDNQHLVDMGGNKSPENELQDLIRDEEYESNRSANNGVEAPSGDDDDDPNQRPNKKKRYHRHTQHQIHEMEAFFKDYPHPDDKQRKELGRRLSLEPLQVKFWFQNKRTQMKAQHERHDNATLRAENDKLRAENIRYKEAANNVICPHCGGTASIGEMSYDEQQIRVENIRLREEIDRITGIAARYVGKSMQTFPLVGGSRSLDHDIGNFAAQNAIGGDIFGASDILRSVSGPTNGNKPMIVELAVAAMEELFRMAQAGDPLWMPSPHVHNENLSEDEYVRIFHRGLGPRQLGMKSEASRDSAVVIMNHINLVQILMDVNQWANMFASIVSRAETLEVLSTGVAGNYNGALQVMTAEFQVPSPLVPTRENYFARYCKQNADRTWGVVDVSLDNMGSGSISRFRRRPSGCLIQELPNGYSKVTWVEHVEVDDRAINTIYKPLVNAGLAFGARRWVAILNRQCERLASVFADNLSAGEVGVISSPEGKKSLLKLAERMVVSFCSGVGASTAQAWTTLSGSGLDDVRVMSRKSQDDPGRPPGIVLSAATSFWLPVPPKRVFDFLRNENSRTELPNSLANLTMTSPLEYMKWDILSNGGHVQEMAHIANGSDPGNAVSLLRINSANSGQCNMLILQESSTDVTGSYVVYAPVDIAAMDVVLNGGDPDYVALLPSGFAILPDGPVGKTGGTSQAGGTLLTVAFQILVDSVPTAKLSLSSVATVNSLIKCTCERIKAAVLGEVP